MNGGVLFAKRVLQALKSLLSANAVVDMVNAKIATKTIWNIFDILITLIHGILWVYFSYLFFTFLCD
jgi:hypothetical protein